MKERGIDGKIFHEIVKLTHYARFEDASLSWDIDINANRKAEEKDGKPGTIENFTAVEGGPPTLLGETASNGHNGFGTGSLDTGELLEDHYGSVRVFCLTTKMISFIVQGGFSYCEAPAALEKDVTETTPASEDGGDEI